MPLDAADLAILVLDAGSLEIRDVDGGDAPFLYASGNWGPGYVSIKGLVGQKHTMKTLWQHLAAKVAEATCGEVDFIAGNATGGIVPGWLLSEYQQPGLGKRIPFAYVRETRKKGGQQELITGITGNPEIRVGFTALIVEELVNCAETTCNSAPALRGAGFRVSDAACVLWYETPESKRALARSGLALVALLSLPFLLDVAAESGRSPKRAVDAYRQFLAGPVAWQRARGFVPVVGGGTL